MIVAFYTRLFQNDLYGGKDSEGNIYVIEKYGGHESPRIQKLDESGYTDFKFYNEK